MFFSLVVVFLLGVIDTECRCGRERRDGEVTDEEKAGEWLQEYEEHLSKMVTESVQAWWNYNVNITDENSNKSSEAKLRLAKLEKEGCKDASRYDRKSFTDQSIIRKFRVIFSKCSQLSDDEFIKLDKLSQNMTTIYGTAKFCRNDSKSGNEICLQQNPGMILISANSRDWEELLWAWEGFRNVTGRTVKQKYIEMISLANEDAKRQGFKDIGEIWRSEYEIDNFTGACDELWQKVKPLYQQMHAYVRRKLKSSYPDHEKDFPSTRQIPAHILGNIWAHTWDSLLDLVKPFPNSSALDVTKLLEDKGYNALRMFRESESFFTSLGFPVMPPEFWNHSLLEKPTDERRKVMCHASAWDLNNRRDFRIKQCTKVTAEDFSTTHHEMGHIHYYMSYKNQPIFFREGANPGFHEAIGDAISLSVMTPEHLRKINLLSDTADDAGSEMNFLMKQALQLVALLPYAYLIDKWRWGVFDGSITPENYNKKYWQLRCGVQGISPPVPRSEEDFDPGAKYHVCRNREFIKYFLSYIIQFQFHKSLCEAAGHVGPLHKCDIYNSTVAGDKLRRMLSLGSSKPWPDAMEMLTGQRKMDSGPLIDYFQPLMEWLTNENKDQDVTWDEDCPSGSVL